MKRIFTNFKAQALLATCSLFLTVAAVAQTPVCGPVAESFNNTGGTTAGFTGDFSFSGVTGAGKLMRSNVVTSAIYTITSPTYQLPASTSFIGYGFIADGTEKVARVEVAIIFTSTFTNQTTTVFLGQFVPAYDQAVPPQADVCRAVATSDLPGFPAGGRYRMRFELTPNTGMGLATQNISFDDFRTNGTLSQIALPVSFIGLDAKKATDGTVLTWKVAGEENVDRYEVESSADGRNFTTLATVARSGKDTYSYTDAAKATTVYYRIKNVDKGGKFLYSTIVRIANGKSEVVIKAFPQPVLSRLTLQHPAINGMATITVNTADGRLVKSIVPAGGSSQTVIDMSALHSGLYLVRFDNGEGANETLKVMKQ